MKPKQRILLTIGIGIFLVAGFFLITEAITKYTGFAVTEKQDISDFKICLREKDITLYINTNNLVETLEGIELTDYLEDIKINNCLRNNQICIDNGISSFPAWKIKENVIEKDISMDELSELSGCKLIQQGG